MLLHPDLVLRLKQTRTKVIIGKMKKTTINLVTIDMIIIRIIEIVTVIKVKITTKMIMIWTLTEVGEITTTIGLTTIIDLIEIAACKTKILKQALVRHYGMHRIRKWSNKLLPGNKTTEVCFCPCSSLNKKATRNLIIDRS